MRLAPARAAVLLAPLIPSSSGEDVYTCNYVTAGAGGIGQTSPVIGGKCEFPFTMNGVPYNACTTTRITEGAATLRVAGSMECGGGTCAPWCPTAVGTGGGRSIDDGTTADRWGYCTCPEPVPAPDASAAAATAATATIDTTLRLPYDQCRLPHAVTPCSGTSKPVVTWKSGVNGYTIFTLRYAEIPYTRPDATATAALTAGFPCGTVAAPAGPCGDDAASLVALNEHLVGLRDAFARYAKLDQMRAGCDAECTGAGCAAAKATACDGSSAATTPPRCDPFPVGGEGTAPALTGRCRLDLWRVKVFAPFVRGSLVIKVHIAPPAAVLDRPTTVIARLDPARVHTSRRAQSGPLQVSIAGGDWGYVCDERLAAPAGAWFGENDNGAQLACKQMFGLAASGQRMHPVGVAGAGENMALHRVVCPAATTVSTRGVGEGPGAVAAHGLTPSSGAGKESIPFGLDRCTNTLPSHDPNAWGLMHDSSPYNAAPAPGAPAAGGLVYPATAEVCSDTEVAQVLCSFADACNGHDLRSPTNAEKQPHSFCRPPTGPCAPGEWEMPANGRAAPTLHALGYIAHMGRCPGCASCPGGASKCYGDCTCVCQTATSCAGVQPAQKNCQTSVPPLNNAGTAVEPTAEWKLGCRWDAGTRGCVDFSASPTAAPTPQPTAWPTASPTRTSTPPPTALPTAADGYLGGAAICVLGYYPLWYTEAAAKASSPDGKAAPTVVGARTFYMASAPAGGAWFGDYSTHGAAPRVACVAAAPEPTAPEPSGCSDTKTGGAPWQDALGATCGEYKLHAHWCERFGGRRDYSNHGYSANKACCVCGGGSTASPTPSPTPPPTLPLTPPPTMPSTPPPTHPGCRFNSGDGVKPGKLGKECWLQCPWVWAGVDKCEFCGGSGVCCKQGESGPNCDGKMGGAAAHVCTCPSSLPLAGPTPPPTAAPPTAPPTQLQCATKRGTRKQGKPCLTKCLKRKFWGGLPADAAKGPECDWCGMGELCVLKGRTHRCVCKPTTDRRAAAVLESGDEEEDDGDE